uniref:Putative secreted protein n=1 Tax=Ixodes ricinus TaxID=34613 RepID=A0A6B0U3K7_IXORI
MCPLGFLGAGALGRAASRHSTCTSADAWSTPRDPCRLHLDASPAPPGTAVGRLAGQVQAPMSWSTWYTLSSSRPLGT